MKLSTGHVALWALALAVLAHVSDPSPPPAPP